MSRDFYMTADNHPYEEDELFSWAIYLLMSQAKWRNLMSPDDGNDGAFTSTCLQFQQLRQPADLYQGRPLVDLDEEQE
jgi:hypothetical protein